MWGVIPDVINHIFLKIDPRVSVLAVYERVIGVAEQWRSQDLKSGRAQPHKGPEVP